MADSDGKSGGGLTNDFKKVMSEMTTMKGLKEKILEVDKAAYGLAEKFALGGQNIDLMRAGLADAASDVKRLGGQFQDVINMQDAAFSKLGRSITLSSDGISELYATTKATGQDANTLVEKFKDIGTGVYDIGKNMETVVQSARDIGVNADAVSSQVLENMDLMNKYNFEGGVQGLAKMAAQAVNLRVNVKDMGNLMEKAFKPDQAIELASKMQMLGAQQADLLDPLRLMDLAQNDPGELMNQVAELGKQFTEFNEETGKFEIAPGGKRQLMELAEAMGIPYEKMTKMALAGSELDDKLSKISFPSGDKFADEDTQKMIANMAEMKDGQYIIKFKDEQGITQEKNVTELKDSDIEAIAKAQSEAPKTMEEIAESQLDTEKSILAELQSMNRMGYGLAGSKGAGDVLKGVRTGGKLVAGGIRDIQGESQDIRKGTDKLLLENLDAINKAMSGEGSLNEVLKTATGSVGGIATAIKDNLNVALTNAVTEMDKFSKSGNMFAETLKATFDSATKYIQEHEKLSNLGINIAPDNKKTESVTTETSTIKVSDFYIKTLPEDKLIMAGGTNLDGSNNTNTQDMSPKEINVKVDLNVSAPPNVDTSQIMALLQNDVRIKQTIVTAIQDAHTSGGMTGPNNPTTRNKSIIDNALSASNV